MSKFSRIFLSLIFSTFLFLLFTSASLAQNKVGINIAARHQEYDQAADIVGPGGWIVILASPGNADEISPYLASRPEVNLILRGHCPSDPLGPDREKNRKFALAWVATLGGIDTAGRKIYFMPWNEPNMTRECQGVGDDFDPTNTECAPFVRDYINDLTVYLNEAGLTGKIALLSPMINQHHANFDAFVEALGPSFFDQFAGISMNLYDNQTCGGPLCHSDPRRNAARFEEVLNKMSISKQAFAVETGVVDRSGTCPPSVTDCPIYNDAQMKALISSAWEQSWGTNSRLRMFSPLSYNPETNPPSWIYGSSTASFMKSIQGGGDSEKIGDFNQQAFLTWRQQKIDNGELIQCPGLKNAFAPDASFCGFCAAAGEKGKGSYIDTSITEKTNGDPIILEYKKAFWEGGSINLGTIRLVNEGDAYRFESYDIIAKHTRMASDVLLPSEIKEKMAEPSDEDFRLPGQPTYRVCEVQVCEENSENCERRELQVKTTGGFSYETPKEYGKGLFWGKFLQAMFAPDQPARGDEILKKPVEKSEEERNKPLPECSGKQGKSKEGIKDPKAAERQTVIVPVRGGVDDFFKSIVCAILPGCETIRIQLEPTHFLAGAESYHREYTNPSSGFVNTQVPIDIHQQDSLVPQKIEANNQRVLPQPPSGKGGAQPQVNIQGINISLKEIGVPWGASVRDGFDSLLCSYLPQEFIDRKKCGG